jgi:hypothetical protein
MVGSGGRMSCIPERPSVGLPTSRQSYVAGKVQGQRSTTHIDSTSRLEQTAHLRYPIALSASTFG